MVSIQGLVVIRLNNALKTFSGRIIRDRGKLSQCYWSTDATGPFMLNQD